MRWLDVDRCRRNFRDASARRSHLVVYLLYLLIVAWVMVRTLRTKRPNEYPPMSVGMGFLWLIIGVATTAYMVATIPFAQLDVRAVTPIFVVGFLLQLLLGAMSYLLPQRMGGEPAVVRASNKEFSRFAAARVTAVNLALLIFMMPSSMVVSPLRLPSLSWVRWRSWRSFRSWCAA